MLLFNVPDSKIKCLVIVFLLIEESSFSTLNHIFKYLNSTVIRSIFMFLFKSNESFVFYKVTENTVKSSNFFLNKKTSY